MKYSGNNPVGMVLAADVRGECRDALLRLLSDYQATAERSMHSAALPATYRHNLTAIECAAACAEVVKEFHAACVSAAAEQAG